MTREEAFQKLYKFLNDELNAKRYHREYFKIDGTRICKECTKHRVNPFYLRADPELPLYLKCFRPGCEHNKMVEASDLRSLGFIDEEAITLLLKRNKASEKVYKGGKGNKLTLNKNFSEHQLDYILERCRIVLDNESIDEYNFISDCVSTIKELTNGEYNNVLRMIDPSKCTCFVSENNNKFAIREINGKIKQSITIDPNKIGNYYTLSRGDKNKKILFITEGVFDCINVYNMNRNILEPALFVATFGFDSYASAIEYYYQKNIDTLEHLVLVMDCPVSSGNYFTYDTEVVDKLLKRLYRNLGKRFVKKISVLYNTASKDFGDFRLNIVPEVDVWLWEGKVGSIN